MNKTPNRYFEASNLLFRSGKRPHLGHAGYIGIDRKLFPLSHSYTKHLGIFYMHYHKDGITHGRNC